MTRVSKLTKTLCVLICATFVFTMAQPALIVTVSKDAENSAIATSTYYDTKWWSLWSIRDKITTSYWSTSMSYGKKETVLCAKNITKDTQNFGYSYTESKSGEVTLGAGVPIKAIELEVGAKVSYSTSTTISAKVKVPKGSTYYVYKRTNTKSRKYKNTIQNQILNYGTWRNNGRLKTVFSTVKEKYPEIIISRY